MKGYSWRAWLVAIVLAVSLGINAYLTSVLIGARADETPGATRKVADVIERRLARLPEDDAAVVRKAFAERRPEIEAKVQELRDARARARDLLQAERVDAVALAAALEEVRYRVTAVQEQFHAVYVGTAGELSPEGRHALLERRRGKRDAESR